MVKTLMLKKYSICFIVGEQKKLLWSEIVGLVSKIVSTVVGI